MSGWYLVDAERRPEIAGAKEPPSRRIRETLSVGNMARLVVEMDAHVAVPPTERLWVVITKLHATSSDGGRRRWGIEYMGTIHARVKERDAPELTRVGQVVTFGPEHVLDWEPAP